MKSITLKIAAVAASAAMFTGMVPVSEMLPVPKIMIAENVSAASVYSTEYNIARAVNYAVEYYNKENPEYASINSWVEQSCTTLTSECLEAGGIKVPHAYRKKDLIGYTYYNKMWTVAADQYNYLVNDLHYKCEKANSGNIKTGDIIFYSKNGDKITHAAICIGFNSDGKPVRAQRNTDKIAVWDQADAKEIYVVHITDTESLTDVTADFVNETISLMSLKNGKYVSLTAGIVTAESSSKNAISVVSNNAVTAALTSDTSIGLRFDSEKFASASMNEELHPVKSTSNLEDWESFRIYRNKDNKYFIQSMRDGKFLEVRNDNKVYASADSPSTWEEFSIEKTASSGLVCEPSSADTGFYFKSCGSGYSSIVDALNSIGAKSTFEFRKEIAAANNISDYSGKSSENIEMLNLLKKGRLVNPEKVPALGAVVNAFDKINEAISKIIVTDTSATVTAVVPEVKPVVSEISDSEQPETTVAAENNITAEPAVIPGDISNDGKADITDLSELSLALVGDKMLSDRQKLVADIDGNGEVDLADLAKFRQFISKVIDSLV